MDRSLAACAGMFVALGACFWVIISDEGPPQKAGALPCEKLFPAGERLAVPAERLLPQD